jgi:Luciferase-like monooxygenase
MTEIEYWTQLAMEQFPPSGIVRQAVEAERAGFAAVNVSDHFQPWWEPGESGHAWVTLGAIAARTERVRIGTGVTAPVHRYHPAIVAQRSRPSRISHLAGPSSGSAPAKRSTSRRSAWTSRRSASR